MKRLIASAAIALTIVGGVVATPSIANAATPYEAICIISTSQGITSKDWHGKNPQDCNGVDEQIGSLATWPSRTTSHG